MRNAKEKRAIIMMVVCASLWSIAGIFIKLIPWHPMVITGVRSLIAFSVVFLYMKWKKIHFKLSKRSFLAGVCVAATFICFVIANKMTTAANAIVLEFTSPVFILIFGALFFRQRLMRADLLVVVVTLGGISLFFLDQLGAGSLVGNLLGILAGVVMAGVYLLSGRGDEAERMSGILMGLFLSGLAGIPFCFTTQVELTAESVLCILALGIFQLGIPYVLFGLATGNCPPLACNLIGAIEPLLNPVWVFLFDGEAPGVWALIGGAIVIAAVTAWCIWHDRYVKRLKEEQSA